jgi:hypothetical protein
MHIFERLLSVSEQDIDLELRSIARVPWSEFLLNPRRLRGSDFLMRWSQGVWSEHRITTAINDTKDLYALPYGPSGTAPSGDVREFELYFERLEQAGLGKIKRPDILVFKSVHKPFVEKFVQDAGGVSELPFHKESDLKQLISKAIVAVECENSLWKAQKMPDFGSKLTAQKRLGGKFGLKKTAVVPTVILKEEDRKPLANWQKTQGVPIHIWHVFFDVAYGIAFDEVQHLIDAKLILPTVQTFQAPGGATTQKSIYKIYYQYAYPLGVSEEEPKLKPAFVEDKNGHILPYVTFEGGKLRILPEAIKVLDGLA